MQAAQLFDLTGEVALVTGASSGLGRRFAHVLAAHGAKVVVAARRADRLAALCLEIGAATQAISLDVTDGSQISGAFDRAEAVFGPVTILVNNAGTVVPKRFLDHSDEDWERIRATNLDAIWSMAQEAARRMIAASCGGTIINITSILAYRVTPGNSSYSVTKAAVAQMTAALALELARHNIRVNAIAPGYIETEMTESYLASAISEPTRKAIPQRRVGTASDLDGALLLLASRKASGFMTGATIVVDGGHMCAFV